MKPGLRKLALTAHITLSVGWLGAVVAYLALAIVGATSQDHQLVRAAYLSMDLIVRIVIVPLSLAALVAGLVESIGTPWGLVRHWWVLAKFALTAAATLILLQHVPAVTTIAESARTRMLSVADFRPQRMQLVVHAGGGLLVLLATTILSVYKPWGMTAYGQRRVRERQQVSVAGNIPSLTRDVAAGASTGRPRWAYIVGYHAAALAVLLIAWHLTGGGQRSH